MNVRQLHLGIFISSETTEALPGRGSPFYSLRGTRRQSTIQRTIQLGVNSYGTFNLQPQCHPGRLRRPPGGNRRRRDTRFLHPPYGRGRSNALGPRHLRDDGGLLAGSRSRRRRGTAGDARVGSQAGGQAEVRGVVDANGLPVDQQPPHRRRLAHECAETQGCDPCWRAPR